MPTQTVRNRVKNLLNNKEKLVQFLKENHKRNHEITEFLYWTNDNYLVKTTGDKDIHSVSEYLIKSSSTLQK